MTSPFSFSEEDWRRIVDAKGSEWKVQLLTTPPADQYTVRLLRAENPRIQDHKDTDILEILRFLDSPGLGKQGEVLRRLEEGVFYSAELEEDSDFPSQVIIHLENQDPGEEDLDDLYSRFPSSPPGPVKAGSLVVAPWNGNLYRAKETTRNQQCFPLFHETLVNSMKTNNFSRFQTASINFLFDKITYTIAFFLSVW